MTQLHVRETKTAGLRSERQGHAGEWLMGILGAALAAVAMWVYYSEPSGTIEVFGRQWTISAIDSGWPAAMLLMGGFLVCTAFGVLANTLFAKAGRMTSGAVAATVVALLAIAGSVTMALVWLL
jgi:hypothetical protein